MNITTFREKVLTLNLNDAEKKRINNLGSKYYKLLCLKFCESKDVNDTNFKIVWHKLNKILSDDEKLHRKLVHNMRNFKGNFIDYGHLAYNGVTDDF